MSARKRFPQIEENCLTLFSIITAVRNGPDGLARTGASLEEQDVYALRIC